MIGQTFTILTAGGGVTGTFDSVTSSLSFIQLGLTHNANDVVVEIVDIITLATVMDESTYNTISGVASPHDTKSSMVTLLLPPTVMIRSAGS